jgi:hypothetical protein
MYEGNPKQAIQEAGDSGKIKTVKDPSPELKHWRKIAHLLIRYSAGCSVLIRTTEGLQEEGILCGGHLGRASLVAV